MQFSTNDDFINVDIDHLIVAGWTARNQASVDHHIQELAELGVAPPSEVPLFYRTSAALITQAHTVQVLGEETSGEVEPIIVRHEGRLWLGVASDHTDRGLEAHSVAQSKQVCAKPVADRLWAFEDVQMHLDRLILRSWIKEGEEWTLYQDGSLATIRPLPDLIEAVALKDGTAMLCGTLPAIGGVRPASQMRLCLTDPVLDRQIEWIYELETLPIVA
ncbi:MAG: DUF2848 domain-containing protein [Stappiaceae bacterium]